MTKKIIHKTQIDFTVTQVIVGFGLTLMAGLMFFPKLKGTGVDIGWIVFCSLILLSGLWKLGRVELREEGLVKRDFLLIRKRSCNYADIKKYKIKQNNLSETPEFNLFRLLKFLGIGRRYSDFRILKIGLQGKMNIRIDERTMTKKDFDLISRSIKTAYNKK